MEELLYGNKTINHSITTPTPKTIKRSIKLVVKIDQFFKELKFNLEPRENFLFYKIWPFQIFPIKSTYTIKLTLVSLMGHT